MALSDSEFAMDQARNVAAIMLGDAIRSHTQDLRIARDEAKLRYETSLEASNAMFCNAVLAAMDTYDKSIRGLMSLGDTNDDDDDD